MTGLRQAYGQLKEKLFISCPKVEANMNQIGQALTQNRTHVSGREVIMLHKLSFEQDLSHVLRRSLKVVSETME